MNKCLCIKDDSPIMVAILNQDFYVTKRGSKIKKGDILFYEKKISTMNLNASELRYHLSLSDDINMCFFDIGESEFYSSFDCLSIIRNDKIDQLLKLKKNIKNI